MESPFSKNNSTIVLYLEPYLNAYYKQYQNIITLSAMPNGPLADMVTMISSTKLSPFQETPTFASTGENCTYVLLRYPKNQCGGRPSLKNADYFMTADDIPSVFSYLSSNGYSVDTSMTKMLQNSKIDIGGVSERRVSGNRKMICIVRG